MEKGRVVFNIIEGIEGHEFEIPMIHEKNVPSPTLMKFVGGTCGPDEYLELAATREAKEEIHVIIERPQRKDIIHVEKKSWGEIVFFRSFFSEFEDPKRGYYPGEEVEEIKFYTPQQLRDLIVSRGIVPTHVNAAMRYLKIFHKIGI